MSLQWEVRGLFPVRVSWCPAFDALSQIRPSRLTIRTSNATARTVRGRGPLSLVGIGLESADFECFPQRSQIRLRL